MNYIATPEEVLNVLETIQSLPPENIPRRIFLPKVRLCCATCGKEYVIPGYEFHKKIKKGHKLAFCSKTCSEAYLAKSCTVQHFCRDCGKPVGKYSLYCSECRKPRQKWRKGTGVQAKEIPCGFCGKIFLAAYRGRGKFAQYCSMNCKNAAHSQRMRGSGNVKFKNNANPKRYQKSVVNAFYAVKKIVRKRDGERCVLCGDTENLNFHHVDLDATNNNPMNVVRLCSACHKKAHAEEIAGTYELNLLAKIKNYLRIKSIVS